MSVTQFKKYRNKIHEGASGPTRMEIQKFFDKQKGSKQARLNKTSQYFGVVKGYGISDIIANAKGTIVGWKVRGEEVEVDEKIDMGKPAYAGSRHKKIEFDKYNKKRKGKGMKDPWGQEEEEEKESRAYLNRQDDDDKKKKKGKGGITPMSQKRVKHGKGGYGGQFSSEENVAEEMSPEDIKAAAGPAMEQYNNEMRKNFPEKQFTSYAVTAPLGGGITFGFAVIPTAKAKGVDLLNAPSHSKYMMHLTNGRGETVPSSKFSIAQLMGRLPVKFRKITAKTPSDAVKKMTDWFKKNKSEFEGQIKEEVEIDEAPSSFNSIPSWGSQAYNADYEKNKDRKKSNKSKQDKLLKQLQKEFLDRLDAANASWGDDEDYGDVRKYYWDKKDATKLHVAKDKRIVKKVQDFVKKYRYVDTSKVSVVGDIREEVEVDGRKKGYKEALVRINSRKEKVEEKKKEKSPVFKGTPRQIRQQMKDWKAKNDKLHIGEEEVDEGKSNYDKEIAAFLKKGGKIKKLSVSKKEVAKAAAEFRKSHQKMTQKEIELDLEDEIEAQANAEGVIIADNGIFLITEEISEKEYDDLKKGDTVIMDYGSAMSGGKAKFKVTAKNVVNKGKVGKVTLKSLAKPNSVKFFLYKRGNKVSAAQGDMGINVKSFTKEEVELGEAKILKKGAKVQVAHPAKGKGMVTGKVVRYDDQGPGSPFYVIDIGERMSEKVPAHKIKEEFDITEKVKIKALHLFDKNGKKDAEKKAKEIGGQAVQNKADGKWAAILWKEEVEMWLETQELQAKMALDDAGIKYSTKNNSITIKKSDKKKAQKAFEKSFKKGGWPTLKLEAATLTEVLKSKDKSVIDAFYDKKPLEGRMLSTDGKSLDKSGMGSQQIAKWNKGKIKITAVSDVKSTEEIVRYMKKSIPSLNFEDRDYRKEYDTYQGKPEQIARRSSRNKARRVMGDKTIEGKDVGHKDNNPMNNDPKNLRNEDPSKNRREPRLRKMESFADYFNRPFIFESSRNDIYNGSISAGVELEKYAKKSGGIDKDDMLATAAILKKGKLPSVKQIPDDTDPRDRVYSIMGKHLAKKYLKKYKGHSPALDQGLKEEEANYVVYFTEAYKYKIDHKTYTSAVEEALMVADKAGYEVDMDDYFNKIATGPRKPQEGKTNIFKIALEKGQKEQKKKLQIQIYGKGKHGYELNCYIQ